MPSLVIFRKPIRTSAETRFATVNLAKVLAADNPKDQAALWKKIRNSWAIGFASKLKKDVSVSEMQKVTVADVEALYFQAPALRNNVVRRQWAFVKERHAFVIVSTLRSEDKQLLSEVEAMVKSFRFVPNMRSGG